MINYILLVSRQGMAVDTTPSAPPRPGIRSEIFTIQRQSQATKMVYDDVPKDQSQDRQGRDPARTREADKDV
jgi:hypothetical protein